MNFTGEALIYSTYLGGSAADSAQSIQVDSNGDAFIAGYTFSSNFPLVNPYQNTIGGGADAFVAELNPAGSALTFSTFLGGSGDDRAYGLALDGSANIYLTGSTVSTNFPTTSGAFQPALKGSSDAFVTKFNPAGSSLLYSTYLGGSDADQGNAIAVTSAGIAFVTGFTESTNFPTQNPVQAILGLSNNTFCGAAPCADAFVTQFNAAGNALTYSTYLGGNGPDFGQAIAVDNTGDPYITGSTSSTNFPVISPPNSVTAGTQYVPPYKSTLTGTAGNAFMAKIDSGTNPNISILPASLNFGNETISVTSALQQITLANPSTAPLTITKIQVGQVGNSITVYTETDNCVGTLAAGGAYCTMNVAFTPNAIIATSRYHHHYRQCRGSRRHRANNYPDGSRGDGGYRGHGSTHQPLLLQSGCGNRSPPQSVTITNTGTEILNITAISTGIERDFTATNQLPAVQNTLAVGQSCT